VSRGTGVVDPFTWGKILFDVWALQIEAGTVIAMRMARLGGGGSLAARESERMVTEKLMLQWELAVQAATGSLGRSPETATRSAVRRTRSKVRANRRRLAGR
jgi:hypothetical protein